MTISGIVGQGVSTQATRGFLQNVSGLAGRVIGIFQNKYFAAAAFGATMFVLIRTINTVVPKIHDSKLVKNVSANFFEKRFDKYKLSREALTWMSASLIMVVGTLGVSKLLQLPFSRATTLAVAGWSFSANMVYLYNPISPDYSEEIDVVDDGEHDQYSFVPSKQSRLDDSESSDESSGSDEETGFNLLTRGRNKAVPAQEVDESLMVPFFTAMVHQDL